MKNILLLTFFLSISITPGFSQDKNVEPLAIGAKAPDFNLPGVDQKNHTLSDYDEYPLLVIIFTCNHCPTAQAYEKKIIKLVDEYRPKGVGFVAISPNDPEAISLSELGYSDMSDGPEDMKVRANEAGFNFPYLYDGETQEVSVKYGPAATPHAFVFDKSRSLRYRGRIDDTENPYEEVKTHDLKNALDNLLSDQEIPVPATKTFGCSVKWSWKDEWTKKLREQWSQEPVNINEVGLAEMGELIKNEGGKLRLINFWATWCGPCVIEFPEFVEINRMYRNRDFEFISVSIDKMSKKEKALEFLKKVEASNQNYIFTGEDIYELIEVVDEEWQGALPYTVLITPEGKFIYKSMGTIDPYELKKAIVGHLGRFYADDK